jgi:hypothetical protein
MIFGMTNVYEFLSDFNYLQINFIITKNVYDLFCHVDDSNPVMVGFKAGL